MTRKTFDVTGMSCAACSARVQSSIEKLKGVKSCSVNLLKNSMDVIYNEAELNENDIISTVKKAGYSASVRKNVSDKHSTETLKKKADTILRKLIVSTVLLCFLMVVSMGHMIGINIFNEHQNVLKGIVEL